MGKGSQLRIQRLETKLAHDKELLESLEQKQSALYKQLNHTSNAGDRLDLNRQIKALEEEIEDVLARYEATEQQLAALKRSSAPGQSARVNRVAESAGTFPGIIVPPTPPALPTFEFERVTLNGGGQEQARSKGQAEYFSEDLGNGVRLEMVSIPGGHFVMGSPEKEQARLDPEGPQHLVSVPAFFMGKYPLTQVQWKVVADLPPIERDLNPDPACFKGIDRPVERVSWLEAMEFCARLSRKTGRQYRLPNEAEWEYACRAGTTTPFHFGETITTELANYDGNYTYGDGPKGEYRRETTLVGHFRVANAFGLYDMHGNVREWCADHWHDSYEGSPDDGTIWLSSDESSPRVKRGGSWPFNPWVCRSASRYRGNRDVADFDIGFRVVCAAPRFS